MERSVLISLKCIGIVCIYYPMSDGGKKNQHLLANVEAVSGPASLASVSNFLNVHCASLFSFIRMFRFFVGTHVTPRICEITLLFNTASDSP